MPDDAANSILRGKPRLLDLFCGAGGAGMGYHLAGFEVVGVDIKPMKRYPFEFHQADAMTYPLEGFDVIHASPPCQHYSMAANIHNNADDHPDLLPATRERLEASGLPWIIENVPGAPMYQGPPNLFDQQRHGVLVCGLALGLGVKRHRLFESNIPISGTRCPLGHPGDWVSVFGQAIQRTIGHGKETQRIRYGVVRGREAMGIDWMTRGELSEAIPPPYTELLGRQIMEQVQVAA